MHISYLSLFTSVTHVQTHSISVPVVQMNPLSVVVLYNLVPQQYFWFVTYMHSDIVDQWYSTCYISFVLMIVTIDCRTIEI